MLLHLAELSLPRQVVVLALDVEHAIGKILDRVLFILLFASPKFSGLNPTLVVSNQEVILH